MRTVPKAIARPALLTQAFALASLSAAVAYHPASHAQLVLEEIIVTAQKREEAAIDVPISMAIETGESLEKKGIFDLQTLALSTPSLYVQDGGRTSQVTMRGLGSPGLDSVESSVGIYIDGVYFSRSRLSRNPMFDMERVEVLRGPQGTLYGRNTIAGAINQITAKPTQEFEGRVILEGGTNIDNHRGELMLSGPLGGGFSGRIAVMNSRRDAYLNNESGPIDGGGQDTEGYRGSLRFQNDAFDATFKYEHMNHKNRGSYAQLVTNPFDAPALQGIPGLDLTVDRNQQVSGQGISAMTELGGYFTSDIASLNAHWDISDNLRITSVTGWYDFEASSWDHITASPVDTLAIQGMTDNYEFWSQEIRLQSTGDGPFNFSVGASVDNFQLTTLPQAGRQAIIDVGGPVLAPTAAGIFDGLVGIFGPDIAQAMTDGAITALSPAFILQTPAGDPATGTPNLHQDISTWSVYFEGTYEFNEKWHLTAGIRYTDEENDSEFAKGTFYLNGNGDPWGTVPNGQEVTDIAVANDPSLAPFAGFLPLVYGPTADALAPVPGFIAALGGTPLARPEPLKDDSITPSAKLQYFANDNAMYYFSVVTGFKAGGFNSSNILPFTLEGDSFESEDSLAFELGGKFTLADGAANLSVSIFHTDFDELQVGSITPQGASTVLNAASARTQGIEIDGAWRLTEGLTIGGAYAFLNAEYTDSDTLICNGYLRAVRQIAGETFPTNADCTFRLDDQFSGNNDLQRAPENTVTLWAEHIASVGNGLELQTFVGVNYRDEANTSIENFLRSDSTTIVNGRIALTSEQGNWTLALKGNNLFDEDGLLLHQDNSGGATKGIITTPRMWSLQWTKGF